MTCKPKLKIGSLYQYIAPRRMFNESTNVLTTMTLSTVDVRPKPISGEAGVVEAKVPFVLLQYKPYGTKNQYLSIKILTTKGIIGWIDVNNNVHFREYSEEPWASVW